MAALYVGRRAFVSAFLSANPWCQLQLSGCTRSATTVNEAVRRSHQGALYPGQPDKRETVYHALCVPCHNWLTEHPTDARANGWEVR
jgi:hypothetical protein